jgi:hypothetical protein
MDPEKNEAKNDCAAVVIQKKRTTDKWLQNTDMLSNTYRL